MAEHRTELGKQNEICLEVEKHYCAQLERISSTPSHSPSNSRFVDKSLLLRLFFALHPSCPLVHIEQEECFVDQTWWHRVQGPEILGYRWGSVIVLHIFSDPLPPAQVAASGPSQCERGATLFQTTKDNKRHTTKIIPKIGDVNHRAGEPDVSAGNPACS